MAMRALEAKEPPALEVLRASHAAQLAQISALRRNVTTSEETREAAASEVRALEYVCELTKDEAECRRQGNNHLVRAYSGLDPDPLIIEGDCVEAIQKTKATLLAAKAELAALRMSIDELQARGIRANRRVLVQHERTRQHKRLIADVDAIVIDSVSGATAPGRMGVSAAGALALLGYDSAEAVRTMTPRSLVDGGAHVEALSKEDEDKLRVRLRAARVRTATAGNVRTSIPDATATLVAIVDALNATARLVNATSAATTILDSPLPPASPKSPRRPLSK